MKKKKFAWLNTQVDAYQEKRTLLGYRYTTVSLFICQVVKLKTAFSIK